MRKLMENGVLVKINSVLIPGVNDEHLKEVSRVVKAKGAFLHNVMPLIAEPEHGTYYGIMEQPEPTPEQLQDLQDACAGDMAMMRAIAKVVFEAADTDPGVPGSRWWVTPGGGVDPGESEEEAAVRELAEETDMVDGLAYAGSYPDDVLAERRAKMEASETPWQPKDRDRYVSPALQAYAAMATSADRGAVRDVSLLRRR